MMLVTNSLFFMLRLSVKPPNVDCVIHVARASRKKHKVVYDVVTRVYYIISGFIQVG